MGFASLAGAGITGLTSLLGANSVSDGAAKAAQDQAIAGQNATNALTGALSDSTNALSPYTGTGSAAVQTLGNQLTTLATPSSAPSPEALGRFGDALDLARQRFTEATRPNVRALHGALDSLDAKVARGADDGVEASRNALLDVLNRNPDFARGRTLQGDYNLLSRMDMSEPLGPGHCSWRVLSEQHRDLARADELAFGDIETPFGTVNGPQCEAEVVFALRGAAAAKAEEDRHFAVIAHQGSERHPPGSVALCTWRQQGDVADRRMCAMLLEQGCKVPVTSCQEHLSRLESTLQTGRQRRDGTTGGVQLELGQGRIRLDPHQKGRGGEDFDVDHVQGLHAVQ